MAKVMGFFTDAQMDSVGMNGAGSAACEKCGLSTSCKSPRMGYTGNGRKGILIVSECPSDHDDNSGTPFSGDTSKWFAEKLRKLGIDLHNDCWKTNAVGCHPKNEADKQPQRKHVIACSPRLMRTIEELKPRFIWLMGEKAITAYFHKRDNDPRCVRWRGLCVPDPDNKAWILPMYHPKYAMQQEKDENFQMVYNKDLSYAVRCSKFPDPPEEMSLKGARIIKDFDEAMDALESTLKICPEKFAFDYECTGLKPYRNAHRIATISWCSDWDTSYAIPYQYRQHFTQEQQDYIADVWTEIMLHKDIKKVIQNSKFEDAWTRSFFGVEPNNVWWCTLNAAHILDTRKHFSGLKFQAHIRWGIPDYDSSMEKYLKTDDGTPFNRVMEAPLNDLLLYNSIDSLLTFRLQEEQEEDISKQPCLERGRAFFMDGLNVLCDMQENGVRADADYYKEQDLTLGKRIITLNETLHDMDEAKKFERVVGRSINFGSNADLSKLFYEILGYKATKQTSSGNDSTDKEALASLKSPLAAKIAEISKLEKIKGTYLAQFLRELDDDGKIHPFFDLHTTQTLRGCVAKGTKVLVMRDFKQAGVPIEDVVEGDYVYCFDDHKSLTIKKVLWAGKTGHKEVVRLHWRSGMGRSTKTGFLDVTPEHLIRLISGKYVPAIDCDKDNRDKTSSKHDAKTRVLACKRADDMLIATGFLCSHNHGFYEHHFIYEHFKGNIPSKHVIHHIDGNHYNHAPDNLQCLSVKEHGVITGTGKTMTEQSKIQARKTKAKNKALGLHKDISGENNHLYMNLSKFSCWRLLAKAAGRMRYVNHDFDTFRKYLKKHGIDRVEVRARYDKTNKYISRSRLNNLLNSEGFFGTMKVIGHNYYRLIKLCDFYGLNHGRSVPAKNNHIISKVEHLGITVDVYDLEVEDCHNFIANEICVHNSSNSPNLQNIPVRDSEAMLITRGGLFPSLGKKLIDWDYGAMEVRVIASITQCPVLIKYINDPSTDMHRDQAMELFGFKPSEWDEFQKIDKKLMKNIRFHAKNGMVFALFYGSYYRSIAGTLFALLKELKVPEVGTLFEWLRSKNIIRSLATAAQDFEDHVKKVEKKFWFRFKAVKAWQEKNFKDYLNKGFIENPFGFRIGGWLTKNDLCNYPIQGTAFHCLVWSLYTLNQRMKAEKMDSLLIGQIHDCCLAEVVPSEEERWCQMSYEIATKEIRIANPWLLVPLDIEFERAEVDQPWSTKKEFFPNLIGGNL